MKSEEKIFMHRAGRKKVKNAHTYISNNKNNKKTLHERWNIKRTFQTIRILKKESKYIRFSRQQEKKIQSKDCIAIFKGQRETEQTFFKCIRHEKRLKKNSVHLLV